ncbi:LOW QUALITY PROTEIN: uncharacterized protein [Lepeophtheirus salmonis]|uniref:LOW QUALITY PROTEIN: uncharacterized protein n=1 Tax=Lepeophtheirus salmonis TaxID=72036 RepID=UPI003AF3A3B8
MKVIITFACLALAVSGEQKSFSSFTGHGATYGYNHGHHGAPSYPQQAPTHPKPTPAAAPAYPAHPPAYPKPAPYHPAPAYAPYKPAPAYAPYKPAPYQPAPYKQPAYAHEKPKHNCTVQDVTESAEVCTPAFETSCETVELPIKTIVDKEYCYISTRTVCTESIEEIPNEICSYNYQKKYEDTTAKTVEVTFKKETNVQMVTVCQPGYGHGYQAYGHQYCKEVAQETAYNVPVVTPIDVPVKVSYPEPIKTCVNKPISLPRVSCSDIQEEKCITVPEIEESVQTIEKCSTKLGAPSCQQIELSLPKQVCIELVYGYAHDTKEAETYA